jgi:hypothetical protein
VLALVLEWAPYFRPVLVLFQYYQRRRPPERRRSHPLRPQLSLPEWSF